MIVGDANKKVLNNENYYGYTEAVGIGSPGAEVHAEMSYTVTLAETNLFEWISDLMFNKENAECIE